MSAILDAIHEFRHVLLNQGHRDKMALELETPAFLELVSELRAVAVYAAPSRGLRLPMRQLPVFGYAREEISLETKVWRDITLDRATIDNGVLIGLTVVRLSKTERARLLTQFDAIASQ